MIGTFFRRIKLFCINCIIQNFSTPNSFAEESISRFFAKIRYNLAYKHWAKFINDIDFDDQLIIKNEEIPFKSKRQKFPTK